MPRWMLVVLFAAVAASLAGSVLAGASPDALGVNWETAGVVGTAFGTIALAAATSVLAFSTWRDVTATQKMVELTARDMESREKPILKATLVGAVGDFNAPKLKVDFRNVGKGPAVDLNAQGGWKGPDGIEMLAAPVAIEPISQGGFLSTEVPLPTPVPPLKIDQVELFVEGTYTDRSASRELKLARVTKT